MWKWSNFITKHWLIETQKSRSSVRFVLRSSLTVYWSVHSLISVDSPLRWWYCSSQYTVCEVYCWMRYNWSSYLMNDLYVECVNHVIHANLMRSDYLSIYLIDKIFWSDIFKSIWRMRHLSLLTAFILAHCPHHRLTDEQCWGTLMAKDSEKQLR
jgi:hypothetical protein